MKLWIFKYENGEELYYTEAEYCPTEPCTARIIKDNTKYTIPPRAMRWKLKNFLKTSIYEQKKNIFEEGFKNNPHFRALIFKYKDDVNITNYPHSIYQAIFERTESEKDTLRDGITIFPGYSQKQSEPKDSRVFILDETENLGEKIRRICKTHGCGMCPLSINDVCLFKKHSPYYWRNEEITRFNKALDTSVEEFTIEVEFNDGSIKQYKNIEKINTGITYDKLIRKHDEIILTKKHIKNMRRL